MGGEEEDEEDEEGGEERRGHCRSKYLGKDKIRKEEKGRGGK